MPRRRLLLLATHPTYLPTCAMASSATDARQPSGGAPSPPEHPPTAQLLSAACNRSSNAVSWLSTTHAEWYPEGMVAYAAGQLVAVYDTARCRVVALMRGHAAPVNAVAWITRA